MAIVTLYSALDMDTADFWNGDVVSATSTEIVISEQLRDYRRRIRIQPQRNNERNDP